MRKPAWILTIILVVVAAAVGFIWYTSRQHELAARELASIDHCADSSEVLFQEASTVQSLLYPDVDHFLGKVERPGELEAKQSLAQTYEKARSDARDFTPHFSERLASEARDMFVAAEQMESLTASPSGTWLSHMSEIAKARGRYQETRTRYELDRGKKIDQDLAGGLANEALRPYIQALKIKVAAEHATMNRILAAEARRNKAASSTPWPLLTELSFEWLPADDMPGKLSSIAEYLSVKNVTNQTVYRINITFNDRDRTSSIDSLDPGEVRKILILKDQTKTGRPIPSFTGVTLGEAKTDL